jgi:DNA polymerase (family 10)
MSFNERLAERFERIAKILELLGEDRFRVNAHSRAARTVESQSIDLSTIGADKKALTSIDGIGPKIADKITEFASSGRITELDELEARVPPGLLRIMEIPGLGPKTVAMMWHQAKVETLEDLKRIIDDGTILTLPRMGEKSVEKIKKSMAFVAEGNRRLELGIAMPLAELIVAEVQKWPGVERAAFAGSLRRAKDTIGDIDILVATVDMAGASERFTKLAGVVEVLSSGEGKSSVRMRASADLGRWGSDSSGPTVQVDLRVIPLDRWGAAMMYFTGSKEHNIRLRERALKRGMTLTEWGLFPNDDDPTPPHKRGIRPIASKSEGEVFAALELAEIPPEIREDRGEIVLAEAEFNANGGRARGGKQAAGLPRLITVQDIKAELHAHTTASDGKMSIVELAAEAKRRGFHTITVTDHSRSSAVAGGLSPERLVEHIGAIHAARKDVSGIEILAGSEVDILADGSLDYEDALLAKLDVVVASPHASLSQEPAVATARLVRAIEHPMVHILGHPTGRLLNRRPGLEPDMQALYRAAKKHDVALEINAHWLRLDLRDVHVKGAIDAGCLVAIDCDVHDPRDFDNLRYGVVTARRGWVRPDRCVNAWDAARLHGWLRKKR